MIESLSTNIQDFLRNVRIVDFLDVALISIFLYLLLDWFRKSASRRAIISISILLLLYVLARVTEMYLTEILIEGLFVLILIGAVVVFQSDIRRLIDRIGNWSFFWDSGSSGAENRVMDIITEASAKMAESKTGALFVIKGGEEWDRHVTGGVELQGNVSLPLLFSIFDPKSPGHDGAVLLEDGRITRFGAHLPLSTHLHKISRGGTRHAAALGLSERCDALVIVISEERGVVSVARSGQLTELEASSDLKSHLSAFWEEHYQDKDTNPNRWWQMRSPRTAVVSVFIAAILWFVFAYNTETVYRSFSVPIEYRNLQSSNIVLEDSVPIEARVTLTGSEQAFRQFDPSELVVSFNLGSVDNINSSELTVTEENINLPSDLALYDVDPQSLNIKARKLVNVDVPVKPSTQGSLPSQLELISMTTDPPSISILAPEDEVPETLATKPVNLSAIKQSERFMRGIVLPPDVKIPENSINQVAVTVRVQDTTNNQDVIDNNF